MAKLSRKQQLYFLHPEPWPDNVEVDGLWNPPGRTASSAKLRHFRDTTVVPMMQDRPDDGNFLLIWAQVEEVLRWREGIAEEDRFWKPD